MSQRDAHFTLDARQSTSYLGEVARVSVETSRRAAAATTRETSRGAAAATT